ncbi:6-phosphofructokinase [bacterium]|nr:6-phosphofructokinase [bacterium]
MKIGVFTSGGDSPGMNAAIRAVVRTANHYNIECYGIRYGYQGMIDNDIVKLESNDVSYTIDKGGTFLFSARCMEFKTDEGRKKAFENLQAHGITALVAIGGDGTFRGARIFSDEYNIPVIGIPGTIDNDIAGTDVTLGYDTASNTAMEAIDKIRDTSTSHNRLFLVEVMGRDAGDIALRCGIATGALGILIPEMEGDLELLYESLERARLRKKKSNIVVVAEGEESGGALLVSKKISEKFPEYEVRVTVLGHIQRGGSPTVFDRELASRMGVLAVEALRSGQKNQMAALVDNKMQLVPLERAVTEKPEINLEKIRMAMVLSS